MCLFKSKDKCMAQPRVQTKCMNTCLIPILATVEIAQLKERTDVDSKVAGSIPLCDTIFVQTMLNFACGNMSLQLKIQEQND